MKQVSSETIEKLSLRALELMLWITVFFLPISKAMVEIGTITALALWIIRKALCREKFLIPRSVLVSYLLFFSICIASLGSANLSEWQMGSRGILKWLQYLGFFCLCAEWFTDEQRARRAILVFLASMLLVTVNGFYQLATGTDFLRHSTLDPGRIVRMKSSLGAPNTLAAFYLFAVPLTLAVFVRFKKYRLVAGALLITFCVGLILTYSRAAFLGLALVTGLTLAAHRKWKWLFVLSAAAVSLVILVEPLRQNFIGSLNLKDITIGERLRYWSYTWDMIKAHPFLGVGLNLFFQKLPLYLPAEEAYRGYAHNSYLQIWAEIGFAGLACFLFPLTRLIGLSFPQKSRAEAFTTFLTVSCLTFLLQAFVDNNFYAMLPAYLFWTFWGMLLGLSSQTQTTVNTSGK